MKTMIEQIYIQFSKRKTVKSGHSNFLENQFLWTDFHLSLSISIIRPSFLLLYIQGLRSKILNKDDLIKYSYFKSEKTK